MDKSIIPITLSFDDSYAIHATVVMKSILENSSQMYMYRFIVFDNGIEEKTKKKLKEFLKSYKNAEIEFRNLTHKTKSFLTTNIKSTAIFDRLFLSEELIEYDKIIQLDTDIIVLGDISVLYNQNIDDCYIACVKDWEIEKHIKEKDNVWLRNIDKLAKYNWDTYTRIFLKMKNPKSYFNAGVMLLNLKLMRQNKIQDKLLKFIKDNEPLALCDQDVLNVVLEDKKKLLPPEFNFHCAVPTTDYAPDKFKGIHILHCKLYALPTSPYYKLYELYVPINFRQYIKHKPRKSKLYKFCHFYWLRGKK